MEIYYFDVHIYCIRNMMFVFKHWFICFFICRNKKFYLY